MKPFSLDLHFKCVFRPAVEADLPKLEWGGQYTHFREIFRRTFQEQQHRRRLMLVAAVSDYPIGQVFIQFSSGDLSFADGHDRAYLYSLRVMEPFQRNGLGTRLVQAAEDLLRERGFHWTTIAAARDNPGAQRLYQRLGYKIFTEDPGRWEYVDHEGKLRTVVEPCYVMEKRIAK